MPTNKDVHTYMVEEDITYNSNIIGKTIINYEVEQYIDTKNLVEQRLYKVACTQRIVIPNQTPFTLTPQSSNSFENYPALLSNQFTLTPPKSGSVLIMDYSPKTLNTAVSTSANQNDATTSSSTEQHTIGSSTSQTNSYGGSASIGFFGDDMTGSVSTNYEHSKTTGTNKSNTKGNEKGQSEGSGSADSFSIKDWGSYASLDNENTTPTWVWGQEFPWNVIQFRYCPVGNDVQLPTYVQTRLWDGKQVYPPSHLSLFGIDFTMKAGWLVTPGASSQTISLSHNMEYVTATHEVNSSKKLVVQLTPSPLNYKYTSPELNLSQLALDPILSANSNNGAVIGFIDNKFITPPTSATSTYEIVSGDNNLLITGTGFDNAMTTTFASSGQATISIEFKILDSDNDYTLYMKHWKTTADGCSMKFSFNGDATNVIEKSIDELEAQGGDNNMTVLNMRNKDYTSVDYHDFLQLGLNTVDIVITPSSTSSSCGYEIRALAIGSA